MVRVRGERDVLDRLEATWRSTDDELVDLPLEVLLGRLEQVRGDLLCLRADFTRGDRAGGAGGRRGTAGVGAESVGRGVGIALLDLDVRRGNAQLLGQDLRVRRL